MTNLYFSISDKLNLKITSDRDFSFSDENYLLLKGYVPGITRLDTEPEKVDLVVEHFESEEKQFIQQENNVKIFDTWNGIFSPDLYHLLYGIVRIKFLQNNLFSVHGACAGKDEQILIVGHSGSGKTSVLLKLLEDSKTRVFSGNKTVVGFENNKLVAIAGTPTITIRGSDKNKVNLWGRSAFLLNDEKYLVNKNVPIKAIVIVRLNDFTQELNKVNPDSALHNLYPYFLDVVNSDIVLSSTNNVFIGTPPENSQKYLVENLKSVLRNIPVFSIIGSAEYVAEEILKL